MFFPSVLLLSVVTLVLSVKREHNRVLFVEMIWMTVMEWHYPEALRMKHRSENKGGNRLVMLCSPDMNLSRLVLLPKQPSARMV